VNDAQGGSSPVLMASYGIGTTRVLAAIAEVYGDDAGLVWPREVAPYDIHVVVLSDDGETLQSIRKMCHEKRISALIDDRAEARAGEKFADAELLGVPVRVVVGGREHKRGHIGIKERASSHKNEVSIEVERLSSYLERK
jgi:prolyl-tRNA synthetase